MNGEDKIRMTVDIYGTQYKLVSNSSPSYIKNVANLVNDEMHRIAEANPRLDLPKLAVLAAVNMADEWTQMRTELELRSASDVSWSKRVRSLPGSMIVTALCGRSLLRRRSFTA